MSIYGIRTTCFEAATRISRPHACTDHRFGAAAARNPQCNSCTCNAFWVAFRSALDCVSGVQPSGWNRNHARPSVVDNHSPRFQSAQHDLPFGSTASARAASRTPIACSFRPSGSIFASAPHLRPSFDLQKPTALFVGRYQPFHLGHQRLIEEGLRRVGQVCIAVRDTHGIDEKNPLPFFAVKPRIEPALSAFAGRFVVVPVPNITNVFYGRDVGYTVERIVLDEETESISGTQVRRLGAASGRR